LAAQPLYSSWLPRSCERYDTIYGVIAGKGARLNVGLVGWSAQADGNGFYNFSQYEPERGVFHRLSYFEIDPAAFPPVRDVFAAQATWDGSALRLDRGFERSFGGGIQKAYRAFASAEIPFSESKSDFGREWKNPKFMTYDELDDYIRYRQARGLDVRD